MKTSALLPILLVAALVASGCSSNDPSNPFRKAGQFLNGPSGPSAYTPEVFLPESSGFAEPSLRVAPDGTIYVTAPGGPSTAAGRSDTVWRSDDHGATFKKLPTPDANFGGGDSDIAVASDGTLYQSGLWGQCISIAQSKDKGQTWKLWPLGCGYALTANDRNWLAADGPNTVYLTFGWAALPMQAGRIVLIRADFSGSAPMTTTVTYEDSYQWPGNVAVDASTHDVYVAYNTEDDHIMVLKSTDRGTTVQKIQVAARKGDTFDSFTAVAVGKDGTPYVTWSERDQPNGKTPDHTDIYYSYGTNHGAQWADPIFVNSFTGNHIFPWIDAAAAGHVIIAWYGTNGRGDSAEKVKDADWNVYAAEAMNANTLKPAFTETKVSKTVITRGSICTSGTGCAAGTRSLLDFFQVGFDANEHANLVWATKAGVPTARPQLAFAREVGA